MFQNSKSNPVVIPLGTSLLLHLLLLGMAPIFFPASSLSSSPSSSPRILRVKMVPPPKTFRSEQGQLVDLIDSKPSEASPPLQTKFLSDKNRRVEKETQARFTGPNPNSSQGKKGSNKLSSKGKPNLNLSNSFFEELSKSSPSMTSSLAPSNYLPQIAMGDETLLNTTEYAYASYWIRVKRQVEGQWNPRPVLQNQKLLREQYSTTLRIILNQNGSIDQIIPLKSSGNRWLDGEAISSVERAAPYLNPPKDIIQPDGKIQVPIFVFTVTNQPYL